MKLAVAGLSVCIEDFPRSPPSLPLSFSYLLCISSRLALHDALAGTGSK